MDRMKKKLASWEFRPPNLANKLVLVESVLQAIPIDLFLAMEAQKVVLKEIIKLQWKFLWSGSSDRQKWALVKWEEFCISKLQVGLGMKDTEKNNEVSGAKIWWIWVNHDDESLVSLWHPKYASGWDKQDLICF